MLEATILNAFVDVIWVGYMWVSGNVFFFLYLIRNGNIGSIQKAEKHKENEISIILSTTS